MKKICFVTIIFLSEIFCLQSCKSVSQKPEQTLEKSIAHNIVQHFEELNHDEPDCFAENDILEFKENGEVDIQLSSSKQIFNITQLHQLHRMRDIKKIIRQIR